MIRGRYSLAVLGLVCTGCPNPNSFTTPRTVPVGKVEHTISVEALGANAGDDSVVVPVPPSYTARIGLADRLELGLHASHMTSLGADLKWNPVRSEAFDLAFDPGGQFFYILSSNGNVFIYYLHAPFLLGFNLSPAVSIVVTPGISMVGASASVSGNSSTTTGTTSGTGFMGRGGIGFDFRTSKKFALHPEVTVLMPFDTKGYIFLAGLGFNFGTLPDYGGGEEPKQ
jgi:hypothetical protein